MFETDPRLWMTPSQGTSFVWDSDIDLTAADVPTNGGIDYVVFSREPVLNEVALVRGVFPYLRRRVNIASNIESMRTLAPDDAYASGWFLFKPSVDGKAQMQFITNQASKRTLAGAVDRQQRWGGPGISWVTNTPYADAMKAMHNPLVWFPVMPGAQLQVTFGMFSAAIANPLDVIPVIGGNNEEARYDYAGVVICGNLIPSDVFTSLQQSMRGKEV